MGELSDGAKTIRVFIKKQERVLQRVPRLPDLRHGKAFWPYPVCEWQGLALFHKAGLPTPEPLALLRKSWYSPRSAVITQSLPCEENLGEGIRDGLLERIKLSRRATLIAALVETIERIHGAGLGWRGMEAKHFYPESRPGDGWRVWLLDCEGVHHRVTRRDIRRQREKFVRKLREVRAEEGFVEEIRQRILPR